MLTIRFSVDDFHVHNVTIDDPETARVLARRPFDLALGFMNGDDDEPEPNGWDDDGNDYHVVYAYNPHDIGLMVIPTDGSGSMFIPVDTTGTETCVPNEHDPDADRCEYATL